MNIIKEIHKAGQSFWYDNIERAKLLDGSLAELIRKIRDLGVTVVLVEHDMELVMDICDRIVVLNLGQKLAEGTPREIQDNPEVIAAYLGDDE